MKTILRTEDLSCPSCIAKIEHALKSLDGVEEAKVYFNTGRIEVEHDSQRASPDDLIAAIQAAGYSTHVSSF